MPNRLHLRTSTITLLLASLLPTAALAHPGHTASENLAAGLMHPLTGLDHVLMLIAVSAWAARLAPQGRVVVATCLALFVGAGALLPVSGGPALEGAIALTVIGAGMLLAIGKRWPLWATATLAALFALVHGFAHGNEGPAGSAPYVVGLMLATGALALAVCWLAAQLPGRLSAWSRTLGAVSATAGAAALIAG